MTWSQNGPYIILAVLFSSQKLWTQAMLAVNMCVRMCVYVCVCTWAHTQVRLFQTQEAERVINFAPLYIVVHTGKGWSNLQPANTTSREMGCIEREWAPLDACCNQLVGALSPVNHRGLHQGCYHLRGNELHSESERESHLLPAATNQAKWVS